MQTLTVSQLFNHFNISSPKAQFVSLVTDTAPKVPNACPFNIRKINVMVGMIGSSYANWVNNQMSREGQEMTFVPQPRKWGRLMENKNMVEHVKKGETVTRYYLDMEVTSAHKPVYVDLNTMRELTADEVATWIPENEAPHTQSMIEKKIIHRDVALENIVRIKFGGEVYSIERDEELLGRIESVKVKVENYERAAVEA
jgi:hypothetical protein